MRYLVVAVIALVIACVPFALKTKAYETIMQSSDLAIHSEFVDAVTNGHSMPRAIYSAQPVFGSVLGLVNRLLHIEPKYLFLGFMVAVMMASAVATYWMAEAVTNQAWFVVTVGLLVCTSTLALYSYGVIYNILNTGVILPLVIGSLQRAKKRPFLVLSVVLSLLFFALHPTGLYLLGALLVFGIVWALKRKKAVVFVPCIALVVVGTFATWDTMTMVFSNLTHGVSAEHKWSWPLISQFVTSNAWVGVLVVAVIPLLRHLKWTVTTASLAIFCIVLGVGVLVNASTFPERLFLDLGTMLALLSAIVISEYDVILKYMVTSFGTASTLAMWVK